MAKGKFDGVHGAPVESVRVSSGVSRGGECVGSSRASVVVVKVRSWVKHDDVRKADVCGGAPMP